MFIVFCLILALYNIHAKNVDDSFLVVSSTIRRDGVDVVLRPRLKKEYEVAMKEAAPFIPFSTSYIDMAKNNPVDWRVKNAVTPAKDQGPLGFCGTFGRVCAAEGQYAIRTGSLRNFSEEELIDCIGWDQDQFAYFSKHGFMDMFIYPYNASGNTNDEPPIRGKPCRYNASRVVEGTANFSFTNYTGAAPSEDQLLAFLHHNGPVNTGINANVFGLREHGCEARKDCFITEGMCNDPDIKSQPIDHSITLVGYGTDSKRGDYWIVKNSWSASFANDGFIKVKKDPKMVKENRGRGSLFPLLHATTATSTLRLLLVLVCYAASSSLFRVEAMHSYMADTASSTNKKSWNRRPDPVAWKDTLRKYGCWNAEQYCTKYGREAANTRESRAYQGSFDVDICCSDAYGDLPGGTRTRNGNWGGIGTIRSRSYHKPMQSFDCGKLPRDFCETHYDMEPASPMPPTPVVDPKMCCSAKRRLSCESVTEIFCRRIGKTLNRRPPEHIEDLGRDCCSALTCDGVTNTYCSRYGENKRAIRPPPAFVTDWSQCCEEKPLDCTDAEAFCDARNLAALPVARRPSTVTNKEADCCFEITCERRDVGALCTSNGQRVRAQVPRGRVHPRRFYETCCEDIQCDDVAARSCRAHGMVLKTSPPGRPKTLLDCCEKPKVYCRDIKCYDYDKAPADRVPSGSVNNPEEECCQAVTCAKMGPAYCPRLGGNDYVPRTSAPEGAVTPFTARNFLRQCCVLKPTVDCERDHFADRYCSGINMVPKRVFPPASRDLAKKDCCRAPPETCNDRETFCRANDRLPKKAANVPREVARSKKDECCLVLTCAEYESRFCVEAYRPKPGGGKAGEISPGRFYKDCCVKDTRVSCVADAQATKKQCDLLGMTPKRRPPTGLVEDPAECCEYTCEGYDCYAHELAPILPKPTDAVEDQKRECCERVTCARQAPQDWCRLLGGADYFPMDTLSSTPIDTRDEFLDACCVYKPERTCRGAERFCADQGKVPKMPVPRPSRSLTRDQCCMYTCDDKTTYCLKHGLMWRDRTALSIKDKKNDCCYKVSCKYGNDQQWCERSSMLPRREKRLNRDVIDANKFFSICCVRRPQLSCDGKESVCASVRKVLKPRADWPRTVTDVAGDCCMPSPVKCADTPEQETAHCMYYGMRARAADERPPILRDRVRDCCKSFTCASDAEEFCPLFNRAVRSLVDAPEGAVDYPSVFYETCCEARPSPSCDDVQVPEICGLVGLVPRRLNLPVHVTHILNDCCVENPLGDTSSKIDSKLTCEYASAACASVNMVAKDPPPTVVTHVIHDCCTAPLLMLTWSDDCPSGMTYSSPDPCPAIAPCLPAEGGQCYMRDGSSPVFDRVPDFMPQENLWFGQTKPVNFDPNFKLTPDECSNLGVSRDICESPRTSSTKDIAYPVDGRGAMSMTPIPLSDASLRASATHNPRKSVSVDALERWRHQAVSRRADDDALDFSMSSLSALLPSATTNDAKRVPGRTGRREGTRRDTRGGGGDDHVPLNLESMIRREMNLCENFVGDEQVAFPIDADTDHPKSDATKMRVMWSVPEILFVPFVRKKWTGRGNAEYHKNPWVSIPQTIDIPQASNGQVCRMRLVSIGAYGSAHYWAYVLRGGSWWKMNDETVTKMEGDGDFPIGNNREVLKSATNFLFEKIACANEGPALDDAARHAAIDEVAIREDEKPKGIRNAGNTCWLSSLLQMLVASPKVRRELHLEADVDPLPFAAQTDYTRSSIALATPVFAVLRNLAVYGDEALSRNVVTSITSKIRGVDAGFVAGAQHDTFEHFGKFMQAMHMATAAFPPAGRSPSDELGSLKRRAMETVGGDGPIPLDAAAERRVGYNHALVGEFKTEWHKTEGMSNVRHAFGYIVIDMIAKGTRVAGQNSYPACAPNAPRKEGDDLLTKFEFEYTLNLKKSSDSSGNDDHVVVGSATTRPSSKTGDGADVDVVAAHIDARFDLLAKLLRKVTKWRVRVPSLGTGIAKGAWGGGSSPGYKQISSLLDKRITQLVDEFGDRRITQGAVVGDFVFDGKQCDRTTMRPPQDRPGDARDQPNTWLDLWGANADNWNPPLKKAGPWGESQAECFREQRLGIFGICTMPTTDSKKLTAKDLTYGTLV
eukprot:g2539.t1